jgi:PAS domain S-box-containing protein
VAGSLLQAGFCRRCRGMVLTATNDIITLVNLVLSITIVVISLWGYRKINRTAPLILGLAYVLFSTSHFMILTGWNDPSGIILAGIRVSGYILVAVGLFAIIRDIVELQETQKALRASEERFRATFDQAAVRMAVVDRAGTIRDTNKRFTDILGYLPQALISTNLKDLHPDQGTVILNLLDDAHCPDSQGCIGEAHLRRYDGSIVTVQAFVSSIRRGNNEKFIVVIEDISARKEAEEALAHLNSELEERVALRTEDLKNANKSLMDEIGKRKKTEDLLRHSLEEKEVLIKEIHHRVKNNLQIIISLLYLQSKKSVDPASADTLMDSQIRVKSMARIHEKLYQSHDLSSIDFEGYLANLTENLMLAYGVENGRVKVVTDVRGFPLTINTAIPLGLIMNEMISNSLKYAFPEGRQGVIAIRGEKQGDRIIISVSDNGIGISKDKDWTKTDTLGLNLIQILTRQLKGTIELIRGEGTEFRISIPA